MESKYYASHQEVPVNSIPTDSAVQERKDKEIIRSDGSDREFKRVIWKGRPAILILPASSNPDLEEARSLFLIGSHLFEAGIPVPRILEYDEDSGGVYVEDVGNLHLQTYVLGLYRNGHMDDIRRCYETLLAVLARMQVQGVKGFNEGWCCDTPRYDVRLVREREVGYFFKAFCRDMLGLEVGSAIESDADELVSRLHGVDGRDFFLHRDFQSRNIMVNEGRFMIIDFQGGRLGPLGYDVASLLLDPYVGLPIEFVNEILPSYLAALNRLGIERNKEDFSREFRLLGLFRMMQALGAYAYLSRMKGRVFFRAFVNPAFSNLCSLMALNDFKELVALQSLVKTIAKYLK